MAAVDTVPQVGQRLELLVPAARASGPVRGGALPAVLADRLGGALAIPLRDDRPTLVANFVATLDGVVSYATPEAAGGGEISGFFEPDRLLMGVLRALADAVLVGAGTVRAAPTERWTPDAIHPASADAFAELRSALGLDPRPRTVVVSESGDLDPAHPGLAWPETPVVVLTTDRGAERLRARRPGRHVDIVAIGSSVTAAGMLGALAERGARLVLCEGGPHLLAELLAADLVDELFLTLAPQLAGRSPGVRRLALVEGIAFDTTSARWADLVEVRRAGHHLFLRYRFATRGSRS